MTSEDETKNHKSRGTEALEWVVAGLAGMAVASVFGFLCFQALTATDAPPLLTARAVSFREHLGLHYVVVSVRNDGEEAAAEANVVGRIHSNGEEHTATATLDYAPSNSAGEVTLVFNVPIEPQELDVSVEGFRAP